MYESRHITRAEQFVALIMHMSILKGAIERLSQSESMRVLPANMLDNIARRIQPFNYSDHSGVSGQNIYRVVRTPPDEKATLSTRRTSRSQEKDFRQIRGDMRVTKFTSKRRFRCDVCQDALPNTPIPVASMAQPGPMVTVVVDHFKWPHPTNGQKCKGLSTVDEGNPETVIKIHYVGPQRTTLGNPIAQQDWDTIQKQLIAPLLAPT